jgi:hypothetical protein
MCSLKNCFTETQWVSRKCRWIIKHCNREYWQRDGSNEKEILVLKNNRQFKNVIEAINSREVQTEESISELQDNLFEN